MSMGEISSIAFKLGVLKGGKVNLNILGGGERKPGRIFRKEACTAGKKGLEKTRKNQKGP